MVPMANILTEPHISIYIRYLQRLHDSKLYMITSATFRSMESNFNIFSGGYRNKIRMRFCFHSSGGKLQIEIDL